MPNTENMISRVVGGGSTDKVIRSRVVWQSDDFAVLMMSTNTGGSYVPVGIAQEWTRHPPGTPYNVSNEAGNNGDDILVYGAGSIALAECGNTVTGGRMVTVDSTARIVNSVVDEAISVNVWDIGMAEEDGAVGDVIRVRVMPQARQPR